MPRIKKKSLALLLSALVASGPAPGALSIWPVRFALAPDEPSTELWIENRSDERALLQFRIESWRQEGGRDRLEAQDRLLASPPIATVPPNTRQLVRVVRTAPDAPRGETAYRLIVDELPDAAVPQRAGVSFRMRYELPVFVAADEPLAPRLEYQILGNRLRLHNLGTGHARLTGLVLRDRHGRETTINEGLVGYVLPGAHIDRELALPDDRAFTLFVHANGTRVAPREHRR